MNSAVVRTRYLLMLDAMCAAVSLAAAISFRHGFTIGTLDQVLPRWPLLVIAVIVKIGLFAAYGVYSRLWRYASAKEAIQMLQATAIGSLVLLFVNLTVMPRIGVPKITSTSIFLTDWILNMAALSFSRFALRAGIQWLVSHHKRQVISLLTPRHNVLVAGAGDVGAVVARFIEHNLETGMRLVGFVDDDPGKATMSVRGFPVLGTHRDILKLIEAHRISEVVIAMSDAPQAVLDEIHDACQSLGVRVRTMPNIYELLFGTLSTDQMRQWRSLQAIPSRARMPPPPAEQPAYRSILVTGGAGFIGANFVHFMIGKYPECQIVVYDKLTYAGNPDNLLGLAERHPGRYAFVKGDICDYDHVAAVMGQYGVDAIVNFAAESHVDRSLLEPDSFLQTNIYGTYALLEAARHFGVRRFHQVSTDEVYGQVLRGSFSEEDRMETRSPYSASKAGADLLAHAYHASFGVPVTVTRGSNNIGPYQYPEKAVPLFVTNAIDDQPLPVYGDGHYVRDYQYVLDHCSAIDFVLHKGAPGEIYNIGGGNEVKSVDVAKRILDKLGKPHSLITFVEDRPGQDRRYSLNCAKLNALGWKAQYDFERALDATVRWYVENEWWWRKIKNGEFKDYYDRQLKTRLENAIRAAIAK